MKLNVPWTALTLSIFTVAGLALPGDARPAPSRAAQTPTPAPAAAEKLKVGDAAPALSLASFVKGEALTTLAPGKTYVLQFWAPWNKASVEQFAALSKLQRRLGDQQLVVVAIASSDLTGTTVEKVQAKVDELGDAVQVAVAWDKGSETKDAFLKAAGRSALPCAVVVDKTGKIAVMESAPLILRFMDSIVAGTHDLEALSTWQAKAARAAQTARNIQAAAQAGKWAEVVAYADELLEVDPVGYAGHAQSRMQAEVRAGGAAKAIAWAAAWIDGPGKDQAQALNAVAWALVDPQVPFPEPDLDLALKAAQRAVDLTKSEDGAVLDTLARVHFRQGNVEKAIELQKVALTKLSAEQERFRGQLQASLKEYELALAAK